MILACGEALIDMLPRTTTDGGDSFAPHAGGAVMNTAIAAARLGCKTRFLSGVSNDLFGQVLTDALDASNVDHSLCLRSDRPTTLAFVKLVNGAATYAFYDENTAGRMIEPDEFPTIPDDVTAAFFGGISLAVEPCATAYEQLMVSASATCVTMIDPNIRPSFITDEDRFRARLDRLLAVADIVKMSDEDLEWVMGGGNLDDMAGAILSKGPKLVCVTKGADGATGYSAQTRVDVASQRVDVVDTVGAGDTFNAGVLVSLERAGLLTKTAVGSLSDTAITDALRLGSAAAAVTVSRAGANPPWDTEL